MSSILNVEWIVFRSETPNIKRPCQRCGVVKPFGSTGKFRVNANGGQLDAWLIYRCEDCSIRWNRTMFERRPVGSLQPGLLEALQRNDQGLANAFACKLAGVSGTCPDTGFGLERRLVSGVSSHADKAVLTLLNPNRIEARVDRVLAMGLGLSRSSLVNLVKQGALKMPPITAKALKRRVPEQFVVEFNCPAEPDKTVMFERLFDFSLP
ncbi:hypothetical protein ACSSV1_000889 [Labrenzia sp. MBR-25]